MVKTAESVIAYVGLGGNLGDSIAILIAAMDSLAALPGTDKVRCSSLYESAPAGSVEQPDFINAVCALATTLGTGDLLHKLMEIEQEFGRRRSGVVGEPRTLDLDLLLYGDLSIQSDLLTLPHPRLHERAFVLYPLDEIAPDLTIPGHGRVRDLMQNCQKQRIERLAGQESRI
jgi:2-amino-4-hydroxy-6-hydroxymethyldihydropteridine diphosphokinase